MMARVDALRNTALPALEENQRLSLKSLQAGEIADATAARQQASPRWQARPDRCRNRIAHNAHRPAPCGRLVLRHATLKVPLMPTIFPILSEHNP
jgi:hypothetical protein